MKIVLFLLGLLIGLGGGWFGHEKWGTKEDISPEYQGSSQSPDSSAPHPVTPLAQNDGEIKIRGEVALAKVNELLERYQVNNTTSIKTKSVVHDFEVFKEMIPKLEAYFAVELPIKRRTCPDCRPAVAIYYGRTGSKSYCQIKADTADGYLLKNKKTAIIVPVFMTTKKLDYKYDQVVYGNQEMDPKIPVSTRFMDSLHLPYGLYREKSSPVGVASDALKRFFGDPRGYDLGHTNP